MDLMLIGSVRQYTKGLARQAQWNLKKQGGDFTGHQKSLRDSVNFVRASDLLPNEEERDDKLSAIVTKAQAGKKLSYDEWEYLRVKSPDLYAKLRQIEEEAERYEAALRRCKTREEAQRLHVSKMGEILEDAKNGDSGAIVRLNRMTQAMNDFTRSEEYHDLPTETEQAIERESERKAEQEALREEAELREAEREERSGSEEENAGAEESGKAVSAGEDSASVKAAGKDGTSAKAAGKGGAEPVSTGKAKAPDARPLLPHTAGISHRAGSTPSRHTGDAPAKDTPAKNHDAPAILTGRRAYQDQRDKPSRARRKTMDTKA